MRYDDDSFTAFDIRTGKRVTLIKRAMRPDATLADTLAAWPNPNSFNDVLARMAADHHASKVADLLVEAGSHSDRASALAYLLHNSHGQALLGRMHKAAETAKDPPMDTVYSIMKDAGIAGTCAAIVAKGATTISEHELVEAVSKVAAERYSGLTEAQAFDKVYSDRGEEGQALRSAVAIAKAMPVTALMVGGVDATHEAINSTESSEAYEQLTRMAEKMRAAAPELSAAQAFERVFTDKRNASLAAKAHRTPTPPPGGAYAWPK